MLDVRVHRVLDRIVVSVWCRSHGGPPHCLYSGSGDVAGLDQAELLSTVAAALRHVTLAAEQGRLDELNDDCLT